MNYSEEQLAILEDTSRYLQVIAAAGSGKTSTMVGLVSRILEKKLEKPERILVVTFTRKATREFQERLEKKFPNSGVKIHTFHAYCLSVLQRYHPKFKDAPAQVIDEEKQNQIWKEILKEYSFEVGGIPYEFLIGKSSQFIDSYFPGLSQKLQMRYLQIKQSNQYLDFEDLVSTYLQGLKAEEAWAKQARKELSRIIIDEFQDTDLIQLDWIQCLDPDYLTVVGDDWQAIYGFRGATVEPFLKFSKTFLGTSIRFLSTNYRSLPAIVEKSQIPIFHNKKNIPKKVRAFRKGEGQIGVLCIEQEEDWIKLKNFTFSLNTEYRILCRTNFRIARLKQYGFLEDKLLTIHASKGLEFSTVLLDLTAGWTTDEEINIEEERRVLYVGLSRAKDNLFLIMKKKLPQDSLEKIFTNYFKNLKFVEY